MAPLLSSEVRLLMKVKLKKESMENRLGQPQKLAFFFFHAKCELHHWVCRRGCHKGMAQAKHADLGESLAFIAFLVTKYHLDIKL